MSAEPGLEPWKEALARPLGSSSSSSSSGGGDWGWDLASDQSSPSTPSPPLPPEAAHFLFGEPALRKRKVSGEQPSGPEDTGVEPDPGPCRPELAAGPVPVSVEALREGAEHGLRDAETHPPGAPGVRQGQRGLGAAGGGPGAPDGPLLQLPPASLPGVSPAGGRPSRSRAMARRTSTTRSWTWVWTR